MSYPTSIKEYFDPDGGINTILVKKNRPRPNVPPPPNPCMGATDSVDLKVSYRGSDWGEGISSAIEVNGEIWNIDHGENLLERWGGVEFSVGGYNFVTTFEGRDGRATLSVEPHHNTDYVIVKIIPDSGDMEGNRLLGVIGGGQIKYDQFTTVAEFCLKPTLKPPISCIGASDRIMFGSQPMEQSVEQTFVPTAMVDSPSGLTEMIYNVTMDGTNYGVIDFVQTPNPMFGNVGLSFSEIPGSSGVCILKIQGGRVGDNHRFKLEPVESRGGNNIFDIYLDSGGMGMPMPEFPTVEHNQDTGVVEFCLTRHECSGATEDIFIKMEKIYDNGEVFTDFNYAVEVEGIVINADHSQNLLDWRGWDKRFGNGENPHKLSVNSNGDNSTVHITVDNYHREGVVKIKLIPPPGGQSNPFISVDTQSNPTLAVDENGVITGCVIIYRPG